MTDTHEIAESSTELLLLMKEKLRVRGKTLSVAVDRARHRMPRRIRRALDRLAEAEALSANPRLRLMLDQTGLDQAERDVRAYLAEIDPADERKGWYLGILGGLTVNLLTLGVLLIAVLLWRGYL
ncbi:MAG: hypothetical protein JJ897_09110 [Marinibacterium sp.]|nr:hypothetical protein [Marinibacterium sp.]